MLENSIQVDSQEDVEDGGRVHCRKCRGGRTIRRPEQRKKKFSLSQEGFEGCTVPRGAMKGLKRGGSGVRGPLGHSGTGLTKGPEKARGRTTEPQSGPSQRDERRQHGRQNGDEEGAWLRESDNH